MAEEICVFLSAVKKIKRTSWGAGPFWRRYFFLWGVAKNYIMYWGVIYLYYISTDKCQQNFKKIEKEIVDF